MAEIRKSCGRYPIPAATMAAPHITRMLERKSRFVAQGCHCATQEHAKEFINEIRRLHPDATHNCWAYVAGPPGDSAHIGSSDDGEPRGSAGRPMLNVLLHCGIGEICVVVSRWFGGIKLGMGGLVHAYQDATQQNLASLPLARAISRRVCKATLGYAYLPGLRKALPEIETAIVAEDYGHDVILTVETPEDRLEDLELALARLTNGSGRLTAGARP